MFETKKISLSATINLQYTVYTVHTPLQVGFHSAANGFLSIKRRIRDKSRKTIMTLPIEMVKYGSVVTC